MSATAMGMALGVKGISPRAKLVLIAVANSADEATFFGYPSRRHLADAADCSIDTVDRCLRELADEGYLKKTEREREDGRGQTSNLYRVFPKFDPSRKNAEGGKITAIPSREFAEGGNADVRPPEPQANAAPPAAKDAAPKEPLSEPVAVVVAVPVGRALIDGLVDRLGAKANTAGGELRHGAVLNQLLRAGCDWHEDIVPAADALAASWKGRELIQSWTPLKERALRLRDIRLTELPGPQPVTEQPQPRRVGKADAGAVIDRIFGASS